MHDDKNKRIAKRFLDDDKPCAVAKGGRVHKLPENYKVVKVDEFSVEKKRKHLVSGFTFLGADMTTINFEGRCKRLGINPEAYTFARDKLEIADGEYFDKREVYPCEKYGKLLNPEELKAIIAWDYLDKRFPEIFTSEGMQPEYQ